MIGGLLSFGGLAVGIIAIIAGVIILEVSIDFEGSLKHYL